MKHGITTLKDLKRTDNWTASFQVSGAWMAIKKLTDAEIIEKAEKLLKDTPAFVYARVLPILKSVTKTFPSNVIDTHRALSTTTHEKLVESVKTKTLFGNSPEEKLVIAVCVYGILELFAKNEDFRAEAESQREALLEKLSEINDFLESTK